jgi:carbamoyl-phosphate synthase large subunit
MTGAGAPGGPGVIKCLKLDSSVDIITADANSNASGRFISSHFIQIPSANDPAFITRILSICQEHKVDCIFPLVTKELFKFSEHKKEFEKLGIKIVVSDFDSLTIANNKGNLVSHLQQQNIATPNFRIADSIEELTQAAQDLGYPTKPIVIKPCVSNGSRGVRILDDNIDRYDLLFNHKPNSTYSTLNQVIATLGNRSFPQLLVSEYLPGPEYTVDCLINKGDIKVILPRKRLKINNGISTAGRFENHSEIIDYSKQILNSLSLSGPIGLQVKQAEDGRFLILEINPRIQGTSCAALGLDINLPVLAVKSAFDQNISIPRIDWNCQFFRYYEEVFYRP